MEEAGYAIHYRINTVLQSMGLVYHDLLAEHEKVYPILKTLRKNHYIKITSAISLDRSLIQDISINNQGGLYNVEIKDDECMYVELYANIFKYRFDEAESVITTMMS